MVEKLIELEVAFAKPDKQWLIPVLLKKGGSVQQTIKASEILKQCPEINLTEMKVGVFGKVCHLDKIVESGDRVEIYRALLQNPMDARRNRAGKVTGNK